MGLQTFPTLQARTLSQQLCGLLSFLASPLFDEIAALGSRDFVSFRFVSALKHQNFLPQRGAKSAAAGGAVIDTIVCQWG